MDSVEEYHQSQERHNEQQRKFAPEYLALVKERRYYDYGQDYVVNNYVQCATEQEAAHMKNVFAIYKRI